jgi:aconitase A
MQKPTSAMAHGAAHDVMMRGTFANVRIKT